MVKKIATILGILVSISILSGFAISNRPNLNISSERIGNPDGSVGFFITYRQEGGQLRIHNILKITNVGATPARKILEDIKVTLEAGDDTPLTQRGTQATANGRSELDPNQDTFLKFDAIASNLTQEKINRLTKKLDSHEASFLIEGKISYIGSNIFSFLEYTEVFAERVQRNNSIVLYNESLPTRLVGIEDVTAFFILIYNNLWKVIGVLITILSFIGVTFTIFDLYQFRTTLYEWLRRKKDFLDSIRSLNTTDCFTAHIIQIGGNFSKIHSLSVEVQKEGGYYLNPPDKFVSVGFNRGGDFIILSPSTFSKRHGVFVIESITDSSGTVLEHEEEICHLPIPDMKNEYKVRFSRKKLATLKN